MNFKGMLYLAIFVLPLQQAMGATVPGNTSNDEKQFLMDTGIEDLTQLKQKIAVSETWLARNDKRLGSPEYFITMIRLGIYYHNFSLYGSSKGFHGYAEKAFQTLHSLYENTQLPESDRPLVWSYLGSSRALMGNESGNPVDKITFVNEGLKYLNEAVSHSAQVSYFPMFMRANVRLGLPDFFLQESGAFKDYQTLEKQALTYPATIPKEILGVIFFNMGNYYKKQKKIDLALQYWKKTTKIAPTTESARHAKEMVALFED